MSIDSRPAMIFSGSASRPLAEKICKLLHVDISENNLSKFADGEIYVRPADTVRGRDCYIVQSICKPVNDNLMTMLVNIDALRRASAGRITAVIPYYGYARQDRKAKGRDPITAKLVANMLTAAGANRILTMDLHASQIQGFFDIPVDHLTGIPLFVDYYREKFHLTAENAQNYVAVAPDVGSMARTRTFAEQVGIGLAVVDKRRPKPNVSEVMHIIGEVEGKTCIILDDMVDTAGSLVNAATALAEKGRAKEVYAAATHGVLSPKKAPSGTVFATDRIENSIIKELLLLDTIPLPDDYTGEKIKQITVANILADAISNIHNETSISDHIFGAK